MFVKINPKADVSASIVHYVNLNTVEDIVLLKEKDWKDDPYYVVVLCTRDGAEVKEIYSTEEEACSRIKYLLSLVKVVD